MLLFSLKRFKDLRDIEAIVKFAIKRILYLGPLYSENFDTRRF